MTLILSIISINVVYVSLNTIRMIFVIKGQRVLASIMSMAEVFVYLMGLNIVLHNLDNPINLLAYCAGYGLGVYAGSRIEEHLALGYVNVQVIVDSMKWNLPRMLREKGFGVTSWPADGKDGPRCVMHILAKRCNERQLMDLLHDLSPNAFIISYEPKNFKGGFWIKNVRDVQ